jgi:hypothetical protein
MNESEKMPSAEKPVTEQATAEGLQQKMAQLRERIAQKRAETDQKVEQSVDEKAVELEGIFTDYQTTEKAMQEVSEDIARIENELREFQQVMREAEALGVPVEEDKEFMATFQMEKDKLSGLEQHKTELMVRAKDLSSNPNVMGKVQEGALKEHGEHLKKEFDELGQKSAEKKSEAEAAIAPIEEMISEKLGPAVEKIFGNEKLAKALELEGKSHDELLTLLKKCFQRPDQYDEGRIKIDMGALRTGLWGWNISKWKEFKESGAESEIQRILDKVMEDVRVATLLSGNLSWKGSHKYSELKNEADRLGSMAYKIRLDALDMGIEGSGDWSL